MPPTAGLLQHLASTLELQPARVPARPVLQVSSGDPQFHAQARSRAPHFHARAAPEPPIFHILLWHFCHLLPFAKVGQCKHHGDRGCYAAADDDDDDGDDEDDNGDDYDDDDNDDNDDDDDDNDYDNDDDDVNGIDDDDGDDDNGKDDSDDDDDDNVFFVSCPDPGTGSDSADSVRSNTAPT